VSTAAILSGPPGGMVKITSTMKIPKTKKFRMASATTMITHDSELSFLIARHVRPTLSCSAQRDGVPARQSDQPG